MAEPLPAWVATIAPKNAEEAERAQRHVRELRIRMGLVNGERAAVHNEPALISKNLPFGILVDATEMGLQ